MRPIEKPISCPSCSGSLRPAVLACDACDLRIEGHFVPNEFSRLGAEDLHLLRIFVHCDGRIRDMESALGLSYPTLKSRLADLKKKLLEPVAPPVARRLAESVLAEALKNVQAVKKET